MILRPTFAQSASAGKPPRIAAWLIARAVSDRRRESQQLAFIKHRLEDEDVRQMQTAAKIRIVQSEDIAGMNVAVELFQHRRQSGREGPHMNRQA